MAIQHSILPWTREGAISSVQEPDENGLKGYAKLPVDLELITSQKVSKKPHAWQSVVPSGESWRCKSSTRCFA